MNVKKLFLEAIKSRTFIALWVLILAQTIVLTILSIVYTRGGGLTIQVHCDLSGSIADCTHAEASWYYTLYFAAFAVVLFLMSTLISLKLLQEKGRILALAWLWFMVAVFAVATVWISAILRIVEL